ncbi:MAG: outer membrane lipoprotein carrier protein LolA [Pelovirga sp.]
MKWIIASCVWLLLSAPGTVPADDNLETVIAALETPFREETEEKRKVHDFSADFVQLSTVVAIDRQQRGEGRVWFKFQSQPAGMPMFRWDYQLPTEQQVISDGTTLWVYVPENRQVIVSDVEQVEAEYGDNPAAFFSSLGDLAANFHITWGPHQRDESGHYRLLLTPRQPSQFFKEIEVIVNQEAVATYQQEKEKTSFPLLATRVTDPQGNLTRIVFTEVRWNLGLADSEFVFDIPDGVEQLSSTAHMPF